MGKRKDVVQNPKLKAFPVTCSRSQNSEYISTTKNLLEPEIYNFNKENSGRKIFINSKRKILDYFQILFTEDLVAHIVKCTNEYCKSVENEYKCNIAGQQKKYEKSNDEMYRFFAIALLMAREIKKKINK